RERTGAAGHRSVRHAHRGRTGLDDPAGPGSHGPAEHVVDGGGRPEAVRAPPVRSAVGAPGLAVPGAPTTRAPLVVATALVVVVVVVVVVLAGCSSSHREPRGGGPLVPWDATVPAAMRPATGAPALPCRAPALAVVGGGFQFTAAISGGTGTVTFRNTGPDAC